MVDFTQARNFLVAPLHGIDIILGMPFRHEFNPQIDYRTRSLTFDFNGKSICLQASFESEKHALLSHTQAKRAIRKDDKTFLILINEVTAQESSESNDTHKAFLSSYKDCFMHDLPPGLPVSRPEDHKIDTIPGSAPPCRAPYRVNPHEQQEIKSQVKDLQIGRAHV